jgi:hypothetical protein
MNSTTQTAESASLKRVLETAYKIIEWTQEDVLGPYRVNGMSQQLPEKFYIGFYDGGAVALHVHGEDPTNPKYNMHVFDGKLDDETFEFQASDVASLEQYIKQHKKEPRHPSTLAA